jgi:hypothetical protein
MPAKYSKFHYTTVAPFNVGLVDGHPAPDAMLSLVARGTFGHKHKVMASAVGEPGWLRFRWQQEAGEGIVTIETAIVTHGEQHLRMHRIEGAGDLSGMKLVEGAAALGFPAGGMPLAGCTPELSREQDHPHSSMAAAGPMVSWVSEQGRTVAVLGLEGYDRPAMPAACGNEGIHSVSGKFLVPMLEVTELRPLQELVALVHIGSRLDDPAELGAKVTAYAMADSGVWKVVWADGLVVEIPPLAAGDGA